MTRRRVSRTAHLDGTDWDALLLEGDGFQSVRWLRVQERIGASEIEIHVAEDQDGAAVAGLVTAWADESVPWLLARPDTVLASARERGFVRAPDAIGGAAPATLLPSLVCGGRHLGRTRPVLADATDTRALTAAAGLVAAAEARAVESGAASVCFPHVDERDTWLIRLLEDRGYDWHESETLCWLDVPPGGFEEYLAGMSQHRRRRVRLERRRLAEAGIVVEHGVLADAPLDRLGELEAALLRKYGNPASARTSTRGLRLIAEEMGDAAMVSVARSGDGEIGFGVVLRGGSGLDRVWYGHRAGFDYDAQGDLPLYYEVLYYSVLERAAAEGVRVLNAGIGSAPAKLARGCRAARQRSYILRTGPEGVR